MIELFILAFEFDIILSEMDIYISTNFSESEIARKIDLFKKRNFIEYITDRGGYAIPNHSKLDELEKRHDSLIRETFQTLSSSIAPYSRYINPVKPLINKSIAFIGIPFRMENEIKSIEETCRSNGFFPYIISSDGRFDAFLNKVLGAILMSKICIFDLTDYNPNVMLELGVALSSDRDIIVIANENKYNETEKEWINKIKEETESEDFKKLETTLENARFIKLVPSDVRERFVHLYKDTEDLKIKLNYYFNQLH
ncbi:MAG: hypothetical protein HYZ34_09260 [Ignavibacteriae bacterium]|nr:hypothetical protein [Ignavibacteriota bacterium]